MAIWQGKKNESQQNRVSPDDTARHVAGGSIRLYLRRGSRNRSFSGMAKPPGREMAADDRALANLRVKQFRTLLSHIEATRPKTL
jgi:hypothetical protein